MLGVQVKIFTQPATYIFLSYYYYYLKIFRHVAFNFTISDFQRPCNAQFGNYTLTIYTKNIFKNIHLQKVNISNESTE